MAKTAAIYRQSTDPLRASQLSFTPRPPLSDMVGHDPPSHLFHLTLIHAWPHWPSFRPLSIFRSLHLLGPLSGGPCLNPPSLAPSHPPGTHCPCYLLEGAPDAGLTPGGKESGLFCSSQSPQGLAQSLR